MSDNTTYASLDALAEVYPFGTVIQYKLDPINDPGVEGFVAGPDSVGIVQGVTWSPEHVACLIARDLVDNVYGPVYPVEVTGKQSLADLVADAVATLGEGIDA